MRGEAMRISVLSSMVFWLLAAVAMPAFAADFSGDIAKLREFLDLDKSYSPSERTEAEAAFAELKARAADMSPAAFQLAVAHIASLTRNGHTMLVAGVWANQFNRTPLIMCSPTARGLCMRPNRFATYW